MGGVVPTQRLEGSRFLTVVEPPACSARKIMALPLVV